MHLVVPAVGAPVRRGAHPGGLVLHERVAHAGRRGRVHAGVGVAGILPRHAHAGLADHPGPALAAGAAAAVGAALHALTHGLAGAAGDEGVDAATLHDAAGVVGAGVAVVAAHGLVHAGAAGRVAAVHGAGVSIVAGHGLAVQAAVAVRVAGLDAVAGVAVVTAVALVPAAVGRVAVVPGAGVAVVAGVVLALDAVAALAGVVQRTDVVVVAGGALGLGDGVAEAERAGGVHAGAHVHAAVRGLDALADVLVRDAVAVVVHAVADLDRRRARRAVVDPRPGDAGARALGVADPLAALDPLVRDALVNATVAVVIDPVAGFGHVRVDVGVGVVAVLGRAPAVAVLVRAWFACAVGAAHLTRGAVRVGLTGRSDVLDADAVVTDEAGATVAARAAAAIETAIINATVGLAGLAVAGLVLRSAGPGEGRLMAGPVRVGAGREQALGQGVELLLGQRCPFCCAGVHAALIELAGVGAGEDRAAGDAFSAVLVDLTIAVVVDLVVAGLRRARVHAGLRVVAVSAQHGRVHARGAAGAHVVVVAAVAVQILVGVVGRAAHGVLLVDLAVAVVVLAVAGLCRARVDGRVRVVAVVHGPVAVAVLVDHLTAAVHALMVRAAVQRRAHAVTRGRLTHVHRAGVAVLAAHLGDHAGAALRIAGVDRAEVAVVTDDRGAVHARARGRIAGLLAVAEVAVVAVHGLAIDAVAGVRIAELVAVAQILVRAVLRRALAAAAQAGVVDGAGVAVVAGLAVQGREHALVVDAGIRGAGVLIAAVAVCQAFADVRVDDAVAVVVAAVADLVRVGVDVRARVVTVAGLERGVEARGLAGAARLPVDAVAVLVEIIGEGRAAVGVLVVDHAVAVVVLVVAGLSSPGVNLGVAVVAVLQLPHAVAVAVDDAAHAIGAGLAGRADDGRVEALARVGIAVVLGAGIGVVADHGRPALAVARARVTGLQAVARVSVVAAHGDAGHAGALGRVADLHAVAGIAVVAGHGCPDAHAAGAGVPLAAGIGVVAARPIGRAELAAPLVADVRGAGRVVVTVAVAAALADHLVGLAVAVVVTSVAGLGRAGVDLAVVVVAVAGDQGVGRALGTAGAEAAGDAVVVPVIVLVVDGAARGVVAVDLAVAVVVLAVAGLGGARVDGRVLIVAVLGGAEAVAVVIDDLADPAGALVARIAVHGHAHAGAAGRVAGVDGAGVAVVAADRRAVQAVAGVSGAGLLAVAGVAVVAGDGRAQAEALGAGVVGRARIAVVAGHAVGRAEGAGAVDAGVVGAGVAVVTRDGCPVHAAGLGIAGLRAVAGVAVIAGQRRAGADAVGAGVARGAGVAVVTGLGVGGEDTARGRVAAVVGAELLVLTGDGLARGADAAAAGVADGAHVAVVTALGVGGGDAARGRVAGVVCAGLAVVAHHGPTGHAGPFGAGVARGAGVAVVAGLGVGGVHAAGGRIAGVVGAGVAVVAGRLDPRAGAVDAGVVAGAGVVVGAGLALVGRREDAARGRVTAVLGAGALIVAQELLRGHAGAALAGVIECADVAVVAGGARRLLRVGAQPRGGVARARLVAGPQGFAHDRRAAHAGARLAQVLQRAGVAVLAGGAVHGRGVVRAVAAGGVAGVHRADLAVVAARVVGAAARHHHVLAGAADAGVLGADVVVVTVHLAGLVDLAVAVVVCAITGARRAGVDAGVERRAVLVVFGAVAVVVHVAGVALAVAVRVRLVQAGRVGAVVGVIGRAVVVGVVIAGVAVGVPVAVELAGVHDLGAVIHQIGHLVAVRVDGHGVAVHDPVAVHVVEAVIQRAVAVLVHLVAADLRGARVDERVAVVAVHAGLGAFEEAVAVVVGARGGGGDHDLDRLLPGWVDAVRDLDRHAIDARGAGEEHRDGRGLVRVTWRDLALGEPGEAERIPLGIHGRRAQLEGLVQGDRATEGRHDQVLRRLVLSRRHDLDEHHVDEARELAVRGLAADVVEPGREG